MPAFLPILSRWIHIVCACIAIGGVFFLRIVLPIGLRAVDETAGRAVLLKCRRVFKMATHTAILLLILSGAYNWYALLPDYHRLGPALTHGLLDTHWMLGLIIFAILLWVMAGKEPPKGQMLWLAVALGLMLLSVSVASTLKAAREGALRHAAEPVSTR